MKFSIFCLIAVCGLLNYVESVTVDCDFMVDIDYGYKCFVKSYIMSYAGDRIINKVTGDHQKGKSNRDVLYFDSRHIVIYLFPHGLTTIFDNLETIFLETAQINEIHSSDLRQFGAKLKNFWMSNNQIESLEADLFQYNKNLQWISFYGNKLRQIDNGTFRGLEELNILRIDHGNPCVESYAQSRSAVIALIDEAEYKCKDHTYIVSNKQLKAQFDIILTNFDKLKEINHGLNATILEMNFKLEQMSEKMQKCQSDHL